MAEYRDYLVVLTPEQAIDRLQSRIGAENILGVLDSTDRTVVGYIRSNRFRLRMPRGLSSNAFAPYLYGWIEARPEGTRIRTRLSLHPFATGVVIMGPITLLSAAAARLLGFSFGPSSEATFLGFAGGAAVFAGFAWLLRQIGRSHRDSLFGFVETIFRDSFTSR